MIMMIILRKEIVFSLNNLIIIFILVYIQKNLCKAIQFYMNKRSVV